MKQKEKINTKGRSDDGKTFSIHTFYSFKLQYLT